MKKKTTLFKENTYASRIYYIRKMTDIIADICGVSPDYIRSRTDRVHAHRKAAYLVAWCVCKSFPAVSYDKVGGYLSRSRCHVYHMVKAVDEWLTVYPEYRIIIRTAAERAGGRESVTLLQSVADLLSKRRRDMEEERQGKEASHAAR